MSEPVAFQFSKASCVALGSFNIYIIQPGWLTRAGIFPKGTPIVIEANMARPGFRLSSPKLSTVWFVSPGKLAIESVREGSDCGRQMAAVLSKLPETPVYGLGNNVLFQASSTEVARIRALDACAELAVEPDGYKKKKHVFTSTLERDGREFNLQLSVGSEQVEMSGNAHLSLKGDGTTDLAVKAAEGFDTDARVLTDLFGEVFGVRIENVASH